MTKNNIISPLAIFLSKAIIIFQAPPFYAYKCPEPLSFVFFQTLELFGSFLPNPGNLISIRVHSWFTLSRIACRQSDYGPRFFRFRCKLKRYKPNSALLGTVNEHE